MHAFAQFCTKQTLFIKFHRFNSRFTLVYFDLELSEINIYLEVNSDITAS